GRARRCPPRPRDCRGSSAKRPRKRTAGAPASAPAGGRPPAGRTNPGAGGRRWSGRKIEPGRRLASNPKLRKLAAVVGRMRQHALALRRRPFERASEEVFEVRHGADLERLLPPELLALPHPVLRRDFARRLLDGELLSYALRGAEER